MLGIDYTMKNGNIEFPDSLHQVHQDGKLNLYQTILQSVSQKILSHTSDQKVPIYGFGAIPKLEKFSSDEVENCFPLTGDYQHPEVKGLQEIQQIYSNTIKRMIFAGPGELEDIINYAKEIADANIKKNIYMVLIILTSGCITDLEEVTNLLAQCAKSPFSLVLVGIGSFDFCNLMKLEAAQLAKQKQTNPNQKPRNIVKFINSTQYLNNLELLKSILLNDIPTQFLQYKELSETDCV